MRGLASILIAGLAIVGNVGAQDVIVRRALPVAPVELRSGNLSFVLPRGSMTQAPNGNWVTRRTAQDADFSYRLLPDADVRLRYTIGAQVEDGFTNGPMGAWTQTVGLRHRPALVAALTEKSSLELALEGQTRFNQAMQVESAGRAELALQTTALAGLNLTTRTGRAEIRDAANVVRDQNYLSFTAEQRLPFGPLRVALAPSVAREATQGLSGAPAQLAGGTTALLVDAAADTTVSVQAARFDNSGPEGGTATSFRSYATQLEQRLPPGATVRLRTGYEEQWTNAACTTAAIFLGAESSIALSDSITGGLQLRQRAVQFLDAAGALPETVFSFSLGGSF